MNCKHCQAVLGEDDLVCPVCGAAVEPEEPEQAVIFDAPEDPEQTETSEVFTETAEEAVETAEETVETAEETTEAPKKKRKRRKKLPTWAIVVISLLGAAVITLGVLLYMNYREQSKDPKPVSYTIVPEDYSEKLQNKVVATCGDYKLTNQSLCYYYWGQYYSLASSYGQYLSYMLDTSVGLDEQMYDDTTTFQQAFLDAAMNMFHGVAAINIEAAANGFALDEESESTLAGIEQSLNDNAQAYGYADADAYLQSAFGTGASVESYLQFSRLTMIASKYLESQVDALEYTDDDLSAYYDENAETYASSGLQKLDKPNVNVRHILITPAETDENGEVTEEALAAAEQTAKDILAEWESGEMTEERFAELVVTYSQDGNASTGGLYENVYPGQMVAEFNDWCFADERKVGDYGLVKTQFGYHIIYFSGFGEEIYWLEAVRNDFLNAKSVEIEEAILEKYPIETKLKNVKIIDVLALQAAEAAAQTEAAEQTEEPTEQAAS